MKINKQTNVLIPKNSQPFPLLLKISSRDRSTTVKATTKQSLKKNNFNIYFSPSRKKKKMYGKTGLSFLQNEIDKKRKISSQTTTQPNKKFKYKTNSQKEEELKVKNEVIVEKKEEKKEEVKDEPKVEIEEEKSQYAVEVVKKRLRQKNLVVTYFGETDLQREKRLLEFEITSEENSEFNEGYKNEFDVLLRDMEQRGEEEEVTQRKNDSNNVNNEEKGGDVFSIPIDRIFEGQSLTNEQKIIILLKRLLLEWKKDLSEQDEDFKRSMQGKKLFVTAKQTEIYLKPLFKSLRKRELDKDILNCLTKIVEAMSMREYSLAGDYYIQMAVGNAPWPIGVTMVGIHERSAREKIFSNQVAHVLNDETQRKYIQSVKRLMTYCQKKYPTDPSKSIG